MQAFVAILKKTGFFAVNLWLLFHVFAIAVSPAPMPPASPLLVDASRLALPYNQAMFLNHGYHYFAPDPGPSTLISYRIERPNDVPIKGRFPDTDISPRLRYHRYFMLAENVWGFPEDTQNEIFEAYARHFSRKHGADRISLTVLSHNPSSIARIRAGGHLSDPEMFEEEPYGSFDFRAGKTTVVLKPVFRELELQPQRDESTESVNAPAVGRPDESLLPIPIVQ